MNIETMPRGRAAPMSFRREAPAGNSFRRLITAKALGLLKRRPAEEIAAECWPSDRIVKDFLLRAASGPALYAQAGWAAELVHTIVEDALEALGPASAGAQLLRHSTLLVGKGILVAPGFVASAANAGFVADGAPIPVGQLGDEAASLLPTKLAAIAVLSEEMLFSSNAEQLIGDTLIRSAAAALDVAMFATTGATAAQPAGLRYNIVGLTPSNDPSGAWEQYFEDAAALINSVSAVGGNGPFFMVANPGRGVQMRLRALGDEGNPYEILGSTAIGADLMAVAPGAVVAAMDPEPEIEVSNAAQLVMNTAPTDVAPTPTTPGAPQKSMWQTVSVALKMRWRVTWALRDARGVAWLTPAWK